MEGIKRGRRARTKTVCSGKSSPVPLSARARTGAALHENRDTIPQICVGLAGMNNTGDRRDVFGRSGPCDDSKRMFGGKGIFLTDGPQIIAMSFRRHEIDAQRGWIGECGPRFSRGGGAQRRWGGLCEGKKGEGAVSTLPYWSDPRGRLRRMPYFWHNLGGVCLEAAGFAAGD